MRVGDVVCAKSITHRAVVSMRKGKNGKQRPIVNQYGFRFQDEHNLLSTVGVFIFLGTYPEMHGSDAAAKFAEEALKHLGWRTDEPPSVDAVGQPLDPRPGTPSAPDPSSSFSSPATEIGFDGDPYPPQREP